MTNKIVRSTNLPSEKALSFFSTLKKISELLSGGDKKRGLLLLCGMALMALLDAFGIASMMPFIAIVSNANLLEQSHLLTLIYKKLNFSSLEDFQFFLGSIVFVFLILSLAFKALITYFQIRFALSCECNLGKRLVTNYLHQPYVWFLNRHSADLGRTILSEVNNVIFNGLFPCLTLLSQGLIVIALFVLLVLVDPYLAISVSVLLSGTYFLIYKLSGSLVKSLSSIGLEANKDRYTAVSEAFGGIKEVKASALEGLYISRFLNPAKQYTKSQATIQIISQVPRYALEAIAVGGMVLIVLILLSRSRDFVTILPTIALYAFAGYRLMPALQQIYHSLNQIRYTKKSVENLHFDMVNLESSERKNLDNTKIYLNHVIDISEISFKYPNSEKNAVNSISISIPAFNSIGIVGSTGGGKTTLVDIILGILEPDTGSLKVDNQVIDNKNIDQWRRSLGYVPQQIYLFDESIRANIALGIAGIGIDQAKVEAAAKKACIHDFIVNQLPEGYDTVVGERGVRLSGGQRQRLGIARALYSDPQVLIFDEGTSSLDVLTESMVMEQIKSLDRQITKIFIAHRLSTVRHCDKIYFLEDGSIKNSGTYDELLRTDKKFHSMISGGPQK
jgi:ABC-type multidrug transport system fused ATPase/permease subunit